MIEQLTFRKVVNLQISGIKQQIMDYFCLYQYQTFVNYPELLFLSLHGKFQVKITLQLVAWSCLGLHWLLSEWILHNCCNLSGCILRGHPSNLALFQSLVAIANYWHQQRCSPSLFVSSISGNTHYNFCNHKTTLAQENVHAISLLIHSC